MKVNPYRIGRYLESRGALAKTSFSFMAVYLVVVVWLGFFSSEGALYRTNVQAEKNFNAVVEMNLPLHHGRGYVFVALQDLRKAYIATDESDISKLSKLDHLQYLILSDVSDANEWQFIAEVRDHTRLVADAWFANLQTTFLLLAGSALLGAIMHIVAFFALRRIEPRLWMAVR